MTQHDADSGREEPMKLYYSAGSPFARVVRMAILETEITIPLTEATLRDLASSLLSINPVGQVPTLWLINGVALTETLLILPFLDRLHDGLKMMPFEPERLAALGRVMGLLEGIAVWNRKLRRPEHERSPGPPHPGSHARRPRGGCAGAGSELIRSDRSR